MSNISNYPIGKPGQKWGLQERKEWLKRQRIKRSYNDDVISKLIRLKKSMNLTQYGALSFDSARYPLYALTNTNWSSANPNVLITGGVHGYETSGVLGAVRFMQTEIQNYTDRFNIVIAPCISPWAYETINRWNPNAIDPNRSFITNSPAEESSFLMSFIESLSDSESPSLDITAHIDLHETTDTDNSEFRPALAARDNVTHSHWEIPDGFYLVGDTDNQATEFQAHIIRAVSKVTHIAPADAEGKIIGEAITQNGVINYATKALGLCTGFTNSQYGTTTEVYPDSPRVDDENCIQAQVTAIVSALDFVDQQRHQ